MTPAPQVSSPDDAVTPPANSGKPPSVFRFTYRGMPFNASYHDDGCDATLVLQGDLGILPYTSDGPSLRRHTLAVMRAAQGLPNLHLSITARQGIELTGEFPVAGAATPTALLTQTIERLVAAKPLLDIIQSLQPPRNPNGRRFQPIAA